MKTKKVIIIAMLALFGGGVYAQSVSITTDNSAPDPSAMLDVKSNSKGMLIPRMTLSERVAIASPATGLIVYQTNDVKGFYSFDGTEWSAFVNTSHPAASITNAGSGQVITTAERNKLSGLQNNPPGTILVYAGETLPEGYLWCDGTAYLVTAQPALYAAIGTAWGGTTNVSFNVPDLRGRFLRGVDGTAGNDPDKTARTATNTGGNTGNNVGSLQPDAFMRHHHFQHSSTYGRESYEYLSGSNAENLYQEGASEYESARGGNETRPKNVYVNYIIKY